MTITATGDAAYVPPRVGVTVSVPVGSVMSSVSVWRNEAGVATDLRTQPSAGFDSRTVYDYECPYGPTVTYGWTADYTDPAAYTTVWTEAWASTASWTVDSGSWNVSGGKVRNTGTGVNILRRTLVSDKYRIVLAGITESVSSGDGYVEFGDGSDYSLPTIRVNSSGVMSLQGGFGSVVTTINPALGLTIDVFPTSVTYTGNDGNSYVLAGDYTLDRVLVVTVDAALNGFQFDDITVKSYPAATTITEESASLTLMPTDAWIVHLSSPGLSFPLSETSGSVAGIAAIDAVRNESNTTDHRILGTATPITTTTGPRSDDVTTMTVATVTSAERSALRALLAADIPVLIQIPDAWELDMASGFYQVGDTVEGRYEGLPGNQPMRQTVLPLTKVQSPVVDVENSGWSYAAVAAEFATYSTLLPDFATYADLLSNTRA